MKKFINQQGQAAIEFVLITLVILSVMGAVSVGLKRMDYISELVNRPWAMLAGMIENGVWETPQKGKDLHPNYLRRGVSFKGDSDG